MKLAHKLPLVQIILTFLFLLSLFVISFLSIRTGQLMVLSTSIDQFYEETQLLRVDLDLLADRQLDFKQVYLDYGVKQNALQSIDNSLEENIAFYLTVYPDLAAQYERVNDRWDSINSEYFTPMLDEIGLIQNSTAGILSTGDSFNDALVNLNPLRFRSDIERINRIKSINVSFILALENELQEPMLKLKEITETYMIQLQGMIQTLTLAISLGSLLIGIFIGIILSSRMSRNLEQLDKSIGKVASGDLHLTVDIVGKDEFRDIGDYFNRLTDTLWFRLDSLKDIMRDLGSSLNEDTKQKDLLDTILELAIDSTAAESGTIYLFQEEQEYLELAAMMGNFPPLIQVPDSVLKNENYIQEWYKRHHIKLGETIIGESAQKQSYIFVKDNQLLKQLPNNLNSDSPLFISSAIILPLMNQDKLHGVLALAKTTPSEIFNELDNTFMKSYSRFVTITLDNFRKYQEVVHKHELNREIGVAAEIQKTLLPGRLPRMKKLQIGAYSDAAKGVSGDYYDVFPLDKNKIAIIICDVSGKGIPASLFMVMIRTVIRTISSPSMNAAEILRSVNQEITGNFRTGTFATISLLIVDQRNYELSYANGAHHPLYLYRARTGKYLKFDADGLPLGIDIHATFGHKRIKIEPQDYMLLFTDGITEARNETGEELSTNRLLKQALNYTGKGAPQMKDSIRSYLKRFCGKAKQHDDETFVAVKVM